MPNTTIFPHTVNEDKADYDLIPVGSILLGFTTRNITTKTYKNTVIEVGNSKRRLKDFISYYSYSDGAILRFQDGYLTTVVPNIYLRDISGVVISGIGDYLAVNSLGNVINVGRKEYTVTELDDVIDGVAPNKYALTYMGFPPTGQWQYKPESSALSKFEDVSNINVPYGILVSYFLPINAGGFGNSYRILPLDISWDSTPTLGGNLDCNGKSIFNQFYNCQNFNATTPITTVQLDTITYSEANIVCNTSAKILALEIVVNQNHCKLFTLNISGFTGILSLTSQADILFENGYPPKIKGVDNTYILLMYKDDVKLKVIILHKNRNMGSFNNGD